MATYTDNGTNTPNGSHKVFTYTFPALQTEDIKVALNGVAQATTKYTASLSPSQIEFNNTSIDSSVQESTGAPKTGVQVRVFRETTVGKNSGDEDPKAVFAAGSSIRAADLNANQEQALFAIHELQTQPVKTSDIEPDAVTNAKIVDNAIDSEHYVDGSIDRVHLEADIIDGSKIEDNAVDNEHIAANAVRTSEIQNSAVIQDKLANNSVGTPELINGSVNSDKILDGTIVNADISSSAAIDASKIVSATGSVAGTMSATDKAKLDGIESGAKDDQTAAEIKTLLQSNKITDSEIATGTLDNRYFTETELTGGALDGRYFTETESDARYFNVSTGDTIKDGETFPDNDTTIATTAAINDRIIDLVEEVGGFVPIESENHFPTANPDINNGYGTLVSIKSLSENITTDSGVTSNNTIAQTTAGTAVNIIGLTASTTYAAGFGMIVETTPTLNEYRFHRLSPKATEVTTVASKATEVTTVHTNITNINAVANNATNINAVAADATDIGAVAGKATEIGRLGTADAVADMALLGTTDVVADLNTLGTADVVADMNMLATSDVVADMNMLAVSDVISDMNDLATSGNITAMSTCSTNIASINNASSNISSVNNYGDQYQVASNNPSTDGGGNALAAGDLYFNTSANELKVYNGSAWQAGVTATGNFALTTGNTFTGDNRYNDGVKALYGTGSDLEIYHSGTYAQINDTAGSGLVINTNDFFVNTRTSEQIIRGYANADVELFYDGVKKFETTSAGVTVTGSLTTGDNVTLSGQNPRITFTDSNHNPDFELYGSAGNFKIWDSTNNVGRLVVTADGNIQLPSDNIPLQIGAGQDLEIYHDGSKSVIANKTGYLQINSTETEVGIYVNPNAAVRLCYDNTLKFETTADGTLTTGVLQVNDATSADAGNRISVGTSQDIRIYHIAGNDSYIRNYTGDTYLQGNNSGTIVNNIVFQDSNGATEIHFNGNKKFETTNVGATFSGNAFFPDNYGCQFGNAAGSADLLIYHDGSNSWIKDAGTGNLNVASSAFAIKNAAANENMLATAENGNVELFYDNSKKFETTSTGISVAGNGVFTGNVQINDSSYLNVGNSGDLQIFHDGTDTKVDIDNGQLLIRNASNAQILAIQQDKDIFTDGHVHFADNVEARFGNSDLLIYHDGSDSYIDETGTGSLLIRTTNSSTVMIRNSGENMARFLSNGASELYYDNSKKFETTSGGASVSGDLGVGNITNPAHYYDTGIHIHANGNGAVLHLTDTTTGAGANDGFDIISTSGVAYLWQRENANMVFGTNGSSRWIIDGSGHLMPNTDSSYNIGSNSTRVANGYFDTLYGDGSNLTGISSVGGSTGVDFNDNVKARFGTGNDLQIYHDGNNSNINDAGTGYLAIRSNNIRFENAAANEALLYITENGGVDLYYDNAKKLETISSGVSVSGNLGIGTTSPQQQLHVHDDTAYKGILVNGNGAPRIGFARSTTTDGEWSVGIDGTNGEQFVINKSNDNSNNKIILSATQNTMCQLTQINGNLKFGSSGNGIDFSATGDGPSMSSEVLDDYEEGTWTVDELSSDNITITNNTTAKYTKIGQVVHCLFDVTIGVNGVAGSDCQLSIPFNVNGKGSGVVGWTNKGKPIQVYVTSNRAYIMDNDHSVQNHITNNDGDRFIGSFTYIAS